MSIAGPGLGPVASLFPKNEVCQPFPFLPRSPPQVGPSLEQLQAVILRHLSEPYLGTAFLCEAFHLSRSAIYRQVRAMTGTSVNRYIRQLRLQRAHELLSQREQASVQQIAFEVGFSDPSYFSRSFSQQFGYSPGSVLERA